MGHRRLASVTARSVRDDDAAMVATTWRDATTVEITTIETGDGGVDDIERGIAAITEVLRAAHRDGAEYALAIVASDDVGAIRCLLRVGFEPELAGPGHEAMWERLLATESGRRGLL
jgi:hypothetical protein